MKTPKVQEIQGYNPQEQLPKAMERTLVQYRKHGREITEVGFYHETMKIWETQWDGSVRVDDVLLWAPIPNLRPEER